MKLTKDQIQFIDNYLIKNKVKYWDVRLELLDHIVSAVEAKMENGMPFNQALTSVHRGFGNQLINGSVAKDEWLTKGIYQSNIAFEKFTRNKQKEVGIKYRNETLKTVKGLFKKISFYAEMAVLLLVVWVLNKYSLKIAAFGALLLLLVPFTIVMIHAIKDKFSRKSMHINQIYLFGFAILSIFNLPLQLLNMTDSLGDSFAFKVVLVLVIVSYPLIRANVIVYFKEYKKYKTYYSAYIS